MARRDSGGFDFDAADDEVEAVIAAEESEPVEAAAATATSKGGSKAPSQVGSKAPSVAPSESGLPEADVPEPEDEKHRRPVTLYRHWVRPKFLQYRYMYEYRTNYYNDVIEYLDKRAKGVHCEIPRAQTWAERVLRTHTNPTVLDYYKNQKKEDKHLIQTIAASIKTHNYHTKAYINQRYASVL